MGVRAIELLELPTRRLPNAVFLVLAALVVLSGVALRALTASQMAEFPLFQWQERPLLSSNDGYYFLRLARDWIEGSIAAKDIPDKGHLAFVAALGSRLTSLHVETVAFHLPILIGPLLAVVLISIGRTLGNDLLGLVAGLIGPLAAGYFERTTAGYFDTDMLAVTMPLLTAWSFLALVDGTRERGTLLPPLTVIAAQWLYPSSAIVLLALVGAFLAWVLLFQRSHVRLYRAATLALIPFIGLTPLWSAVAVIAAFVLLTRVALLRRHSAIVLLVTIALVTAATMGDALWSSSALYLDRGAPAPATDAAAPIAHASTVDEARIPSWGQLGDFAAGDSILFIVALTGYLLLVARLPRVLVTLPLLGVGLLSLAAGMRFGIYAVPAAALGLGYLFALAWSASGRHAARPLALIILAAGLYPNLDKAVAFTGAAAIFHDEVQALDRLRQQIGDRDHVVTWWDYGYAAEYFSGARALVDGGRFDPDLLALTARVLCRGRSPETITRLAEYLAAGNDTRESAAGHVYLYLPYRMIYHYPVIDRIASVPDRRRQPIRFEVGHDVRASASHILLDGSAVVERESGVVSWNDQSLSLARLYVTGLDDEGGFGVRRSDYERPGPTLIVMSEYPTWLIVDESTSSSTFLRLFALEDYEPAHYRPIALTSLAKIYRVQPAIGAGFTPDRTAPAL